MKRYQTITIILIICAIQIVAQEKMFRSQNGIVSIEAEHATEIVGWQDTTGVSGAAMQDMSERHAGYMLYKIYFDEPGLYFMSLLARTPGGTSTNDCFITIDDKKLYGADAQTRPDGMRVHGEEFTWTFLPKGPGSHTPDAIRDKSVYAKIDSAGWHQLKIGSRSKLFIIDKIVLKLNDSEKPTGLGPEETFYTIPQD